MTKYKVVFHIDEQSKSALVLNNIRNLIIDLGEENVEIEMLANGDAVKILVQSTSEFGQLLNDLAEKHVAFCACANSLRNFVIQKNELLNFVTVVSAGVSELVKKQAIGWAYIRP